MSIFDPRRVSIIHSPMILLGKAFCANSDELEFPTNTLGPKILDMEKEINSHLIKKTDLTLSLLQCINHPGPIFTALKVVFDEIDS